MESETKPESILEITINRIRIFFINLQITLSKFFCCKTADIEKELSVSEIELKDILKEKPLHDSTNKIDICMINNLLEGSLILNEDDVDVIVKDVESEKIKIFENFSRILVEMMDEKNKEFVKENGRGMMDEEMRNMVRAPLRSVDPNY